MSLLLGGSKRRLSDTLFHGFTLLIVLFVVVIIGGVTWVLVSNSMPTIQQFGWSFLSNQAFDPVHNVFGVAPAIFGTLVTSAFALIFAVPIGVGTAIFLVDFCPRPLRVPLAFIVELLAAVPSVIYGLFGFLVLAPWLQSTGEPWLQKYLGFLPFFQGQFHGLGLLAAGLILVIMVLPLITSVSREVILTTPSSAARSAAGVGINTLGSHSPRGTALLAHRHYRWSHPGFGSRARRNDGRDNGYWEPGLAHQSQSLQHGLYALERDRQPVR